MAVRQPRGEDFSLRSLHIVGNPAESNSSLHVVENRKGGAPVSIAGLADRAGVDEITPVIAQLQLELDGATARVVLRGEPEPFFAVCGEATLQVCMPEEVDGG